MSGLGANAYVSLTEQTADYPTFKISPTSRDVFARVVGEETDVSANTFESAALGSRTVSQLYPGERAVDSPIEFEVGFEGVLMYLWKHVLGGYDFTTDALVGGTVLVGSRRHQFYPKEVLPYGFSMEIGLGGVPAADKVLRYPGTKVSSLEFGLEQGKIMTCKAQMLPRDEDHNESAGAPYGWTQLQAPTFAAIKPVKFWYHSSLTVAGSTVAKCRSWKMKIDNDLDRNFNLSLITDEPLPKSKRKVTLEATIQFEDMTHYRKYKQAIDGSFALFVQSGPPPGATLNDQVIVGTTPYAFLITGSNSRITAGRPKQTDAGIILMPLNCQLYAPTGSEVLIDVQNGQATVGAEIL